MVTSRLLLALACLAVSSFASIEHAMLMPDPALIGYKPVPLGTQHSRLPLTVRGTLPAYLNGTLYRGAPGQWPDGWWLDALVTHNSFKFDAATNSVHYSMRYNMDQVYNQTVARLNTRKTAAAANTDHPTMMHPANTSWPTGVAYTQVQGKLLTSTGVSNQNEIANSVVLDVIQVFPSFLPCSTAFKTLTLNNSINNWQKGASGMQMSTPYRLTMPLSTPGSKVKPEQLGTAKGIEFPTIRYDELNGKPYTFVYGVYWQGKSSAYYDALIKLNVQTGAQTVWSVVGHYVGEPIFVADPNGISEDAGVVITTVIDSTRNQTYVIVLDALTMTEVAKAGPTPSVIPHGYHGRYIDATLN